MNVTPIKTSLFRENDVLIDFLIAHLPSTLQERSVVVITSKIVGLSQGRTASIENKKDLITSLSKEVISTQYGTLTLTNDGWCINAGLDESNADLQLVMLPENPFDSAKEIHIALTKHFSIQNLGVILTDTRSVPLRQATIGRAIAFAGFNPIKSYVGKADLYGRNSRSTHANIADALAASAVLVMGEGNEQIPLAVITDAPVEFASEANSPIEYKTLSMPPEDDIYKPLFNKS